MDDMHRHAECKPLPPSFFGLCLLFLHRNDGRPNSPPKKREKKTGMGTRNRSPPGGLELYVYILLLLIIDAYYIYIGGVFFLSSFLLSLLSSIFSLLFMPCRPTN